MGRVARPGQPIWLNAREEVDARLVLHARTDAAIETIKTIEARIMGRFIDGIQVEVHRPAYTTRQPHTERQPDVMSYESTIALVR